MIFLPLDDDQIFAGGVPLHPKMNHELVDGEANDTSLEPLVRVDGLIEADRSMETKQRMLAGYETLLRPWACPRGNIQVTFVEFQKEVRPCSLPSDGT